MGRRLDLATGTHISGCLIPFLLTGTAVGPCSAVQKWFIGGHHCHGRLQHGCQFVGSSSRKELTTEADFQLSFHCITMMMTYRFGQLVV